MARTSGTLSLGSNIEPKMSAPLDAREVVNTKADLLAAASYPYSYLGLTVYVKSEQKSYTLIGDDTTVESNWMLVGTGSGQTIQVNALPAASAENFGTIYQYIGMTAGSYVNGYWYKSSSDGSSRYWERIDVQPPGAENVVDGYFNAANNLFYLDNAFTEPVTGAVNTIYIDVSAGKSYRYNSTIFVRLDEEQITQVAVLPTAAAALEGKILQFTGVTATYTNGYWYKCIEDPENVGSYIWTNVKVQDGDVNTIEGIQLNGTTVSPDANKIVNIPAIPMSQKGANSGVAELDATGKVPSGQLPSYVDDVVNGYLNSTDGKFYEEDTYTTEIPGETGKIYVTLDTDKTYRWSGLAFVEISESLALGETSSTAYAGNKGKQNADDIADLKTGKQDVIQYATMPAAASTLEGSIVQYVGTTTASYTNGYFYECIEDPESAGTYIWTTKAVQSGSGGGSLGINITSAIEVGGIDAGTTYAEGTSYDTLWNDLLNPTLYPTYTAPSASLSYSADSYYAVGSTIEAKAATVSYNAGAITVNGVKQNDRGGAATLYSISTSGADTEFSDSDASSGSFSVPALTRSTKGSIVLTGTVAYAQGPQPKDSKGNDYGSPEPSGSKTASKTMNFILPYYYGASNSSTVSNFTGLTSNVSAKGQKTFKFTTNNQYMVMAYDSSYGNLSSILDSNGFETISGWTKSTLTVDGFSYYVYVANSATTDTNASFTFKY